MTEYEKLGLKLIVFADTHGFFEKRDNFEKFIYKYSQFDLCVLLGDHTPKEINMILEYVPDYKVLGVLGNHDSKDLYKNLKLENINLHGKCVEIKGIKIAGIEGSNRYKTGRNYAMLSQEESLFVAQKILNNYGSIDILISHDKPFEQMEYDIAHTGLIGISRIIDEAQPKLHLHGHYHINESKYYKNGTKARCIFGAEYIEL